MDNRIASPTSAMRAYAEALKRGAGGSGGEEQVSGLGPKAGGFAEMLKSAAMEPVNAMRESERVAAGAASGKTDLVAVATAVTNAETAVDTVVAVRDRVIAAYQEILRMPI